MEPTCVHSVDYRARTAVEERCDEALSTRELSLVAHIDLGQRDLPLLRLESVRDCVVGHPGRQRLISMQDLVLMTDQRV